MSSVKRLCPVCGAANAMERVKCCDCGVDMRSNLPVPLGERLPVPWKEVGTSLAVGAGVLALRAGLHLARGFLERKAARSTEVRVRTSSPRKVRRWLSRREEAGEAPRPEPHLRVWGRRMRGRWRSGEASHLEVEEFYWQAVKGER